MDLLDDWKIHNKDLEQDLELRKSTLDRISRYEPKLRSQ